MGEQFSIKEKKIQPKLRFVEIFGGAFSFIWDCLAICGSRYEARDKTSTTISSIAGSYLVCQTFVFVFTWTFLFCYSLTYQENNHYYKGPMHSRFTKVEASKYLIRSSNNRMLCICLLCKLPNLVVIYAYYFIECSFSRPKSLSSLLLQNCCIKIFRQQLSQ